MDNIHNKLFIFKMKSKFCGIQNAKSQSLFLINVLGSDFSHKIQSKTLSIYNALEKFQSYRLKSEVFLKIIDQLTADYFFVFKLYINKIVLCYFINLNCLQQLPISTTGIIIFNTLIYRHKYNYFLLWQTKLSISKKNGFSFVTVFYDH